MLEVRRMDSLLYLPAHFSINATGCQAFFRQLFLHLPIYIYIIFVYDSYNRVGTSREVLPEWGVDWQTKDFVRDGVSAPAEHIG